MVDVWGGNSGVRDVWSGSGRRPSSRAVQQGPTMRRQQSASPLERWLEQDVSESTSIQRAGGTGGAVQRAQAISGYQPAQYVASQAGVPSIEDTDKGFFSTIFDFIGRTSSGTVGFLTGAAGATRYASDGRVEEVPLGSYIDTAIQRAKDGYAGREYYTFADFGAIARKRSEGQSLSGWETVANLGKGIVFDTLVDPLTYVSFGGSIFGRIGSMNAVKGRAAVSLLKNVDNINHVDFFVNMVNGPRSPVSLRGAANRLQQYFIAAANETSNEALKNFYRATDFVSIVGFQGGKTHAAQIIAAANDRLELAKKIALSQSKKSGELIEAVPLDPLRQFAIDTIPDVAAWHYILRGSGGTRRWAESVFGKDAGWDYYNSLPIDIQGGLRVRVPFLRHRGLPVALKVPGIGGGVLSDRLAKIGIPLGQAVEFTNKGRDAIRALSLSLPGYVSGPLTSLMYKGKWGEELASALIGATGKKLYFKKVDGVFSDFLDYSDHVESMWIGSSKSRAFSKNLSEKRFQIAVALDRGMTLASENAADSKQAKREVAETFWDLLGERERLHDIIARIDNSDDDIQLLLAQGMTLAEYHASRAAILAAEYFDAYGAEILAVTKNSRKAQGVLNNYAPRRRQIRAALEQYLETFGTPRGKAGASSGNIKDRYRDVEWWRLIPSEEAGDGVEAFAVKYFGPHQIYTAIGEKYDRVYLDDPLGVLADYTESMDRTLSDLRIIEHMRATGSLTMARSEMFDNFDQEYIEENLVELLGGVEQAARAGDPRAIDFITKNKLNGNDGIGRARQIRDEIVQNWSLLQANNVDQMMSGTLDADINFALIGELPENQLDALTRYLSEETPGFGIVTRDKINDYVWLPGDNTHGYGEGAWSNPFDNSRIVQTDEGWIILDGRPGPNFGKRIVDPETGENVPAFRLRQQAEAEAAQFFSWERAVGWNNYAATKAFNAIREIDKLVYNSEEGAYFFINQMRSIAERHRNGDISLAEHDALMSDFISKVGEILQIFGREEKITVDPVTREVTRRGVQQADFRLKDEIRKLVEREGLYNREFLSFAQRESLPATEIQKRKREIQSRIVEYLGDFYAPRATMDALTRAFEVIDTSKGLAKFYHEFYMPFYNMVRSMMTIGRGPGFVLRNVRGGMWNNFITGVTYQHNNASVAILLAKEQAKRRIRDRIADGESLVGKEQEVMDEFVNILKKKYKDTGTFIDGVQDGEALAEIYTLAFDTGMVGSRAGRVVDYLNYDPGQVNNPLSALRQEERRKILESYASTVEDAGLTLADKSKTKYRELAEYIAYDNAFIRRIMAPSAEMSENYLRLAAFIKGVQEIGLEPVESGIRGLAASSWVKASQFDYADLSFYEQYLFRNILPFYVWMRNNIPLQVRSFIHQPAHVAQAARVYQGLVRMFADDDDERSPDYVNDALMFEIDKERFSWLPDSIEPNYDVAMGILWGDPLIDVNQLLRVPGGDRGLSPIRFDRLPQNINPLFSALASLVTSAATPRGPDFDERNRTEPAWWQAPYLPWDKEQRVAIPGLGQLAPEDQEYYGNRGIRDFIKQMFPVVGTLERIVPGLGDPRQQNRLLTSWVSTLFGLPFVTVDDYQVAGQLRRDTGNYMDALEEMFGETAEYRVAMVDALLKDVIASEDPYQGTVELLGFLSALNVAGIPQTEVDIDAAKHAWNMYKIVRQMVDNGSPAEDVLASMWSISPEGSDAQAIVGAIWNSIPSLAERGVRYRDPETNRLTTVSTDEILLKNMFALEPPTDQELEELGITRFDIDAMTQSERVLRVLVPLIEMRNG